jgi:hypothetical protein
MKDCNFRATKAIYSGSVYSKVSRFGVVEGPNSPGYAPVEKLGGMLQKKLRIGASPERGNVKRLAPLRGFW